MSPSPPRLARAQVERKLHKDDVDKLVRRIMGVRLAPHVLDVLFYLFSDEDGTFDGPAFTDVMKRRNRLPGHKVRCAHVTPRHAFVRCCCSPVMSRRQHAGCVLTTPLPPPLCPAALLW